MNEVLLDVLAACLGLAALVFLYRDIADRWPTNYFGPVAALPTSITSSSMRYLMFRFAPPLLIFTLVGMYAPGASRAVWICAALYAVHGLALSVKSSIVHEPGSTPLTRQRAVILAVITAGLASCAGLAVLIAAALAPNRPAISELLASAVSAVATALVVVAYLQSTRNESPEPVALASDTVVAIRSIAAELCVDPRLAVAIAIVENQQRPPWIRRVERVTKSFRRNGSYGLFQVAGHGVVSDLQSCRIALGRISGTYPERDAYGNIYEWRIMAAAELHNPDSNFAKSVATTYGNFAFHAIASSSKIAPDGHDRLELWHVGRFGGCIRAYGSAWLEPDAIQAFATGAGSALQAHVEVVKSSSPRSTWMVDVPLGCSQIRVRTGGAKGAGRPKGEIRFDLSDDTVVRDLALRDYQVLAAK